MASNIQIQPLKVETHNETESWRRFLRRFEVAAINVDFGAKVTKTGADLKKEVSKRKAASLLSCMGDEGMAIFDTFGLEVQDIKYEELRGRFDQYFSGRENKTILRHRFLSMGQREGESLSDFVQRVKSASGPCGWGDMSEDMPVHVVLKGLVNEELKGELLRKEKLKMTDVMAICARFEAAERTVREFGSKGRREEVSAIGSGVGAAAAVELRCFKCKKVGHTIRECPETECYRCRGRGHVSKDCKGTIVCRECGKQGHIASRCFSSGRGGRGGVTRGSGSRGRGGGPAGIDRGVRALHDGVEGEESL